MAVTAALCADQVTAAVPVARPQSGQVAALAGRFVNRLTQSFRRSVAARLPQAVRRTTIAAALPPTSVAGEPVVALHRPLSPFQFRLPPPAV
jgi:hypothetical protein